MKHLASRIAKIVATAVLFGALLALHLASRVSAQQSPAERLTVVEERGKAMDATIAKLETQVGKLSESLAAANGKVATIEGVGAGALGIIGLLEVFQLFFAQKQRKP